MIQIKKLVELLKSLKGKNDPRPYTFEEETDMLIFGLLLGKNDKTLSDSAIKLFYDKINYANNMIKEGLFPKELKYNIFQRVYEIGVDKLDSIIEKETEKLYNPNV